MAFASLDQVAEQRHVLDGGNLMTAAWTARSRCYQVEALPVGQLGVHINQLRAVLSPLTIEHDRQSVNHHVQEASHEQSKQACQQQRVQRIGGEDSEHLHDGVRPPSPS